MATLVSKSFGAGKDFTTAAALRSYIASVNAQTADTYTIIDCYDNLVLSSGNWGPAGATDTQRILLRPAPGMSVNDLETSGFDVGTTGITLSGNSNCVVSPGLDICGFRHLFSSGSKPWYLSQSNGSIASYDNIVRYNRIYCTASTMLFGNGGNRALCTDNLIVNETTASTILDQGARSKIDRNTFIARGAALGVSDAINNGNGNTGIAATDNVFIGHGTTISNTRLSNCFSNTTPTGGWVTDVTVVAAAGGLVTNETNNFLPSAGGGLIGTASAAAKGTLDILGGNRGSAPDAGARQRVAASPAPTGTITGLDITTTTGNKRRVTVTGTTANNPTSGSASITPVSVSGNNAVAQNNVAVSFGSGTFTVIFDDVRVGRYSVAVTLVNGGGTGTATGTSTFEVIGATGVITSQPAPNGQSQSISGTTSGTPDSGSLTWPIDPAAADGTTQGPFALTLGTGTFSDLNRTLPPGTYLAPVVTFTIAAGTSFPATGGSAVKIIGISGNPQTPEAPAPSSTVTGVTVSPASATINGAGTQQFTATVQGTNSPSQTVTWSKVSGVGAVSSSGLYTAPAGTQAVQNAVIKATSTQDASFSANASITIPVSFAVKITVPLGSAAANLTGLKWAWHDQPTPDLFVGPPTDKGAAETSDGSGTVVILLPNSTKTASGQVGHIEIINSDGTTTTPYSGFVGPWAVD